MPREGPSKISTGVWLALIVALTNFLVAGTSYLAMRAEHEPPAAARHSSEPAKKEPPGPALELSDNAPTTDRGVLAARELALQLNPLIESLQKDVAISRARICQLEKELREARATQVAAPKRERFRTATSGWASCSTVLDEIEHRKSLREAFDDSLGR